MFDIWYSKFIWITVNHGNILKLPSVVYAKLQRFNVNLSSPPYYQLCTLIVHQNLSWVWTKKITDDIFEKAEKH